MDDNDLAQPLKLRVTTPKPDLSGLDALHARLESVRVSLTHLHRELNKPLALAAVRSETGAGRLRQVLGRGSRNAKELAKSLGFDERAFLAHVAEFEKRILGDAKYKRALRTSNGNFNTGDIANRAIFSFSKEQQKHTIASLANLEKLGAAMRAAERGGAVGSTGGAIQLDVPASKIKARVGPGQVDVPPPGSPTVTPRSLGGGGSDLIGRRSVFKSDGSGSAELKRVERSVDELGNEFDTFFKVTEEGLQATGKVVKKENARQQGRRRLLDELQSSRNRLLEAERSGDQKRLEQSRLEAARAIRSQLSAAGSRSVLGDTFYNQLQKQAERLETQAAKAIVSRRQGDVRRSFEDRLSAIQRSYQDALGGPPAQLVSAMQRRQAELRQLVADPNRLQQEGVTPDQIRRAQGILSRATVDARRAFEERSEYYRAEREAERQRSEMGRRQLQSLKQSLADQERAQQQQEARQRGAQALFNARRRAGDTVQRQRFERGQLVSAQTTGIDPATGAPVVRRFNFSSGAVQVDHLAKSVRSANKEVAELGRNIIDNTAHVTTWASGVFLLYGTIDLLRSGMLAFLDTGAQTARLDQVFRGVGGSTRDLVQDVLELASAERRMRGEALEAAIAWSRLGLTRQEINKAVKVSLQAANVAEISAADATEHLAAVMVAFKLDVDDLTSVLGQLNEVSNTYRVTNRDLLAGIARTGGVARQAGLDLSQLIGIIGAGVGSTGQTGENIGNAVKTIITKLGNPGLQERLSNQFQINLTTDTGDLKEMNQILADLYVRYQDLNEAQRASLRFQVAGAFQSSRLSAILDSYVKAQVLAVHSQLNLNSAQEENAKIIATLQANLRGFVTELERFASTQPAFLVGGSGLNVFVQFLRNILDVSNTLPGQIAFTGFLTVLGLVGVKLSMVSIQAAVASNQGGVLANTWTRLGRIGAGLSRTLRDIIRDFADVDSQNPLKRLARFTLMSREQYGQRASRNFARATSSEFTTLQRTSAGLAGAFQKVVAMVPFLASGLRLVAGAASVLVAGFQSLAITGVVVVGMWAVNKAMDYFGRSSDRAVSHMDRLTQEFQKFKNAGEAAQTTIRLMDTAVRTFQRGNIGSEQSRILLENVADVAYPEESGKQERPRTDALKKELQLMLRQKDTADIITKLEELQGNAILRRRNHRQQESETRARQIALQQQEVDRLKSSRFPNKENLAAQEAVLEKLKAEQAEALALEYSGNDEQILAGNAKLQQLLERQKSTLEAIRDIYAGMPAVTERQRVALERIGLESQLAAAKRRESDLNDEKGAIQNQVRAEEVRLAELDKKIQAKQEEAAQLPYQVQGKSGVILSSRKDRLLEEIEQLEKLKAEIGGTFTKLNSELEEQKNQIGEVIKDAELKLANLSGREALAIVKDQVSLRRAVTESHIESFTTGDSQAERFVNRFKGLTESIRSTKEALSRLDDGDVAAGRLKEDLLIRESALEQTRLDLIRQSGELRRQEKDLLAEQTKELERQLALAKPSDLLQFASARRAADAGNVGIGSFFAASPDIRQQLQSLIPSLNPALRDIRAQRALVDPYQPNADLLNRSVQSQVDAALRREVADRQAAMEAGKLAGQFNQVGQAMKAFQSQMESFSAYMQTTQSTSSSNPQAGGRR